MDQDQFQTLQQAVDYFSTTLTRPNGQHSRGTRNNKIYLWEYVLQQNESRIARFNGIFVAFRDGRLNTTQATEFLRELNALYREYYDQMLAPLRRPDVRNVGVIDDDCEILDVSIAGAIEEDGGCVDDLQYSQARFQCVQELAKAEQRASNTRASSKRLSEMRGIVGDPRDWRAREGPP